MDSLQVPHHLSVPIYGIVAHAHIHLGLPSSEYAMLQALALIEATAKHDKYPGPFHATIEDFASLTGLTAPTVIKAFKRLEKSGVIIRKAEPFTPTLFKVNWSKTALTFDQFTDLADAQDALRLELNLPM